ncbi:hypothetical protein BCAH820_B0190 (plasmid) [Bacillus cereus AH820]|uniref:Uncharacterized protein n=1 Tax=Bacillus cereus (strain AH820) TaxID=405535 RepID=B7JTT8_BACC0|nr:hypothetical protein BCAH820_B0190 [Bacillus cereus AH820]
MNFSELIPFFEKNYVEIAIYCFIFLIIGGTLAWKGNV